MAVQSGWVGILGGGELILWQGAPDGRFDFSNRWSAQSILGRFLPFGVAMAFAITHRIGDVVEKMLHIVLPLFGLRFLGTGLYRCLGQFCAEARRRRNNHCTLTNRAANFDVEAKGKLGLERYAVGPDMGLALEDSDLGAVWFPRKAHAIPRHAASMRRSLRRIGRATQTKHAKGFERNTNARAVYAMMRIMQINWAEAEGGDNA